MKKFLSIVLTLFMFLSLFTVFVSAYDDCGIHLDVNCDDYCDRCNQYSMESLPGLNATGVISDGVLVVIVYNNHVRNFSSIDTSLKYNPDKLQYYASEYSSEGMNLAVGGDVGDRVTGSFARMDSPDFAEDEPFILYIVTFVIKDDDFTVNDVPTLTVDTQDEVIMYSGSEYKANPTICFDTTHIHIDEDMDRACDICAIPVVYIGDMNNDGNISAADARIALRIAAKLQTVTEYELFVGDLDGDGKITAAEARKILRVAAMIDSF